MRAAYEEGKILWRRQPIVEFLQKPELEAATKEKLELVLEVRDYAKNVLKLDVGGSYASYSYVDRPDLSYVLTAAPKTELKAYTWWFLIVGHVPYKGYFSKQEAQAAAEKLQSEGYDTNIRPTAAFSTLGWFDDPLLSHLLHYDKVTLADLVFHELFHNTLYVKGAGAFNESSANFVGGRAAIEFCRERFGPDSPEHQKAVQAWHQELEFAEFIEKLGDTLIALYTQDLPKEEKLRRREEIFDRAKKEWDERISARTSHRFRRFSRQPLNNAVMIHYILYLKDLKLFEELYQAQGRDLARVIRLLKESVPKGGDPFKTLRALLNSKD
jgi:predicted aminopeptidase